MKSGIVFRPCRFSRPEFQHSPDRILLRSMLASGAGDRSPGKATAGFSLARKGGASEQS